MSHWDDQAMKHGASHCASWGDNWCIELEIAMIGAHIKDGDRVLDAGCGNGYSTLRQDQGHKLDSIWGIDASGPMVAAALLANRKVRSVANFCIQDITDIQCFPAQDFDVVYTTRCLINLPTWEEQKKGIAECLRVCKPGGKVILCEAFWEPLQRLNALRLIAGLAPLVEPDFNRYLKQDKLVEFIRTFAQIDFSFEDFSSVYYLGSRFLRELVTDPSKYPGYSNPVNEAFYRLEQEYSGGGFGVQQACVIQL